MSSVPSKITLVLALGLLGPAGSTLLGCRRPRATGPAPRAVAPPARGLAAGHPGLAAAVRAVLADCQLDGDGAIQACSGAEEEELAEVERKIGPAEALRTYCRALEEEVARPPAVPRGPRGADGAPAASRPASAPAQPPLRAFCLARLARLSSPALLRRIAGAPLLECLLEQLRRPDPLATAGAPALARAAALLAAPLSAEDRLLRELDGRRREVRCAALQALWANGRLRLLPAIRKLLGAERDPQVRVALIRGFGDGMPLEGKEQELVCAVLGPLLTATDSAVSGAATSVHAGVCPEQRDAVLEAVDKVRVRGALGLEHLTAVRAVNGFLVRRGTAAQRKRSVALLSGVTRQADLDETLRAAALDHLSAIDLAAARKIARRLRAELGPPGRTRPSTRPASQPGRPLLERIELLLEKR